MFADDSLVEKAAWLCDLLANKLALEVAAQKLF
jgi:hypothetical protein